MAEAKIRLLKQDWQFQDQLMAAQTARLMSMQGRVAEKPIQPAECMTFAWDEENRGITTEMTEEDMTRFDQNMDAWGGVRPRG